MGFFLVNDIKIGDRILMDDGLIELTVVKKTKNNLLCEIITGGELSNNKSINLPDGNIHLPYMSEKDKDDIKCLKDGKLSTRFIYKAVYGDCHLNELGYKILADLVHKKGKELDYWN